MRSLTALAASLLIASAAAAQDAPAVDPKDVATPEAIVQAMYDVISGPAGQPRNWDRMRGLMSPDARFYSAAILKDGSVQTSNYSVDKYVELTSNVFARIALFERGATLRITRYGHTAVIESPYESRHTPGDPAPFARGINQFVLINDGKRWWVTEIIWEVESPNNPLPPEAVAVLQAH